MWVSGSRDPQQSSRAREPEAAHPRFSRRPAAVWVRKHIGCGFQAPETPSKERAQGAGGSPSPLFPTSSGGLGAKTACVAFLRKGAVGLVLLREECFLPFADCRAQELGWCLWRVGALVRSGPASLGLYCWGMGEEGLRTLNLASP